MSTQAVEDQAPEVEKEADKLATPLHTSWEGGFALLLSPFQTSLKGRTTPTPWERLGNDRAGQTILDGNRIVPRALLQKQPLFCALTLNHPSSESLSVTETIALVGVVFMVCLPH